MNSNNNNDLNDTGKILAISQTSSNIELTAVCYLTTTDYINVGFYVDEADGTCTIGSRCNLSISLVQIASLSTVLNSGLQLNSTLAVTGATILYNNLTISGSTQMNSTLVNIGATTHNSSLTVSGLAQLNSTLSVTGSSTFNNNVILNNGILTSNVKSNAGTELSTIINYLYTNGGGSSSNNNIYANTYLFYNGQPSLYDGSGNLQGTTFNSNSGYQYLLFSNSVLVRNGNWTASYANSTRLSVPTNGIYTISFGMNATGLYSIELFISLNSNNNNDKQISKLKDKFENLKNDRSQSRRPTRDKIFRNTDYEKRDILNSFKSTDNLFRNSLFDI